jgi:aerobic carbon-monoxide dehydrogenase small subunit
MTARRGKIMPGSDRDRDPAPAERCRVRLTVNGRAQERETDSRRLLSDFLRHELGLTGTHVGCEQGACGSCTVLLDGAAVRSCLMFAIQADGADVATVEGLAAGGRLHPLQQAFMDCHGLQCGFCTPGMLMSAVALLQANPDPTEAHVRDALSGNLCRCTGYQFIVDAVLEAGRVIREGRA